MQKLLIVDDEEINRITLETGFSDMYEILQAENGKEALDVIYSDGDISAVLMDLNMPGSSGFDALQSLNETGLIKYIPVYIITSSNNDNELLRAYELGAVDVVSKPFNIQFLRRVVSNSIELYTQRNNLSKIVEEKTKELIRQNNRLVEAMADIVEFRSNESGTHVKRVSGYTKIIMDGLVRDYEEYAYLKDDIESITFASCLHDLGKIAISDSILNKPGRLTPEEFDVMKNHTIHGHEQIVALKDIMEPKLFNYSVDIARHHHERYSGKGYPDQLKGEEISVWSQAVALADVYDALTSERCYKQAFDHETAVKMIIGGECGEFNPKVAKTFEKLSDKCNELRHGITRKCILIVDDSDIDRTALRTMLLNNYDVAELNSGTAAYDHLKTGVNHYDLVIFDVIMPEMDGFQLLDNLGKDFISSTPIVICSVDINEEVVAKASKYGIRDFIKKPYNYDLINKKISTLIGD